MAGNPDVSYDDDQQQAVAPKVRAIGANVVL